MRGNVNYQVQQLYATVNAIGESKHTAKQDARAAGAKTTSQIAQRTGIHSYATADAYRSVWRQIGEHAKGAFGIKDMERLSGQHVTSWLQSKVDAGVSRATFDQYAAAAAKLGLALNRYAVQNQTGNSYSFGFKEVRAVGARELGGRNHEGRAYREPEEVVGGMDAKHQLAAKLQAEGGARIKEASLIKEEQLKGIQRDPVTGQMRGQIDISGKGGKERTLQVTPETYAELKAAVVIGGGKLEIIPNHDAYKAYLENMKQAAANSGQDYSGSHGLRWAWAQSRMSQCQTVGGMCYEEALGQVSREMGHERSDITEHYLG